MCELSILHASDTYTSLLRAKPENFELSVHHHLFVGGTYQHLNDKKRGGVWS